MSEELPVPTVNMKSENFFSSNATEYQYFQFKTENVHRVAITFFKGEIEADITKNEPQIFNARKALCTLSLDLSLAKLLAQHINAMGQGEENSEI